MNKPRTIKWRFPKAGAGEAVRRSTCERYELIESGGKGKTLWSLVLNPD